MIKTNLLYIIFLNFKEYIYEKCMKIILNKINILVIIIKIIICSTITYN